MSSSNFVHVHKGRFYLKMSKILKPAHFEQKEKGCRKFRCPFNFSFFLIITACNSTIFTCGNVQYSVNSLYVYRVAGWTI